MKRREGKESLVLSVSYQRLSSEAKETNSKQSLTACSREAQKKNN